MKKLIERITLLFHVTVVIYMIFIAFFAPFLINNVKCVFILRSIGILLALYILISFIKPNLQNKSVRELLIWIFKLLVGVSFTVRYYNLFLNNTKDLIILINSNPKVIVDTIEYVGDGRIYLTSDRFTRYETFENDDFIVGKEYTLYYLPNTKTVISYKINE